MSLSASSNLAIRFGVFVVHPRSGELYRDGARVKLQEQPFAILTMLLERGGQVVTRQELREKLWPNGTFVDFDHGINVAIAKIRQALADSAERSQFVETVGRRGYRFIAAVEAISEELSPLVRGLSAQAGLQSARRHSVGREKEHAELAAAFESAAAGHGLLACVEGEPGIGKTTLVHDFLFSLQAGGRRFRLAIGRCSQRLAGEEAYLPFLEALESLSRNDDGVSRKLREVAPSWYAQLFPLSENDPSDVALHVYARATTQERVKRELAAFLEEIVRLETLVLFFDDLHWADSSTIDLLTYLATKFDTTRILVIGAYRPSELYLSKHPFIGVKRDLQSRALCREVAVELLSPGDVERYVGLEFPENSFPREFTNVIHSKTEGNALFMVDLLRYLFDRNVIVRSDSDKGWCLAQSLPDLSRDLPQSVRSMIERKIEQVSPQEHEVLVAAAVEGYDFDSATAARAIEADALEVEELLERLDHIHAFVKRTAEEELPDGTLTVRYRFVHVLYQNALYASLTPTRRATLSAALAHALEAFYGEKTSAVALQLGFLHETARDPGRASDYFLVAAQNAQRLFANQEAATLARRGLALLRKIPETPERTRRELVLQVTLAFSLMSTLGYAAPETGANMAKARELCQQLGDTGQLVAALFGLFTFYLCRGDMRVAHEAGEHLASAARKHDDPAQVIMAHWPLAFVFQHTGELVASREHFEQTLRYYERAKHNRYLELYKIEVGILAQGEMVRTLWLLGFPDQAIRRMEEALVLAREVSIPVTLAFCQRHSAMFYQNLRQPENARNIGEACIALCEEHGIMLERAWVGCPYGWAIAQLGQIEEGILHIRAGLAAQLSVGAEVVRSQFQAMLAETLWHAGRAEEGLQAVEDALEVSKRNAESIYDAELWRLKGELLNTQDKTVEAESCFERAIKIARQQAAKSLELRASTSFARLRQKQGKRTEASRLLGEIYGWFTEGFDTADLKEAALLLEELS